MVDEATINQAAQLLLEAAPPGSKVILFGSHARGQAGPDSDVDFLVIEPEVKAKRAEMVRLHDVLRSIGVYADVLVASEETFRHWADTPNTVYHEAAREGRVYDAVQ